MHAEYKRDMNHNYLVLHGEEEIDTASYQVRMLVGNVIPSLLKCRIQGMDGKFSVCYDITSRQSLMAFYENKKFGGEDLKLIFGEFIRVMEDAAEYLMNPGQLVLMPEYMFLEVERREIYFCFMPGYQKDVKEQFQALTEYILPKIDHEDETAVTIGYGVYRRALEDNFHLEHVKEEVYRKREEEGSNREFYGAPLPDEEETFNGKTDNLRLNSGILFKDSEDSFSGENPEKGIENYNKNDENWNRDRNEKAKKKGSVWKQAVGFAVGILALGLVLTAKMLGYLPETEVHVILGAVLAGMGTGMLIYLITKQVKKRKKREEMENPERYLRRERAREEREFLRQQEEEAVQNCGETVVLSMNTSSGPSSLVSREPGALATIYLEKELTVIGKLKTASDAVIDLPTVSRVHAKIRKRDGEYYLTDLNSRNGTTVNGRLLKAEEEYCLQNEDEVDFAQARYVFIE